MASTNPALLRAFLTLLLSSLAKQYIPVAACLLALLSFVAQTRTQHHRIEKLEYEYWGQRSINRECLERHKAAILKLQQDHKLQQEQAKPLAPVVVAETPCVRVHYQDRDAITEARNKDLKDANTDLLERIVRLQRKESVWQCRLDVTQQERNFLQTQFARLDRQAAEWKHDAIKYKNLSNRYESGWRDEVVKRKSNHNAEA